MFRLSVFLLALTPFASAYGEIPGVGQTGILGEKGKTSVLVATNDEAWEILNSQIKEELLYHIKDGTIFPVPGGTRVNVIKLGFLSAKIRVSEGKYTGRLGWVSTDFLRKATAADLIAATGDLGETTSKKSKDRSVISDAKGRSKSASPSLTPMEAARKRSAEYKARAENAQRTIIEIEQTRSNSESRLIREGRTPNEAREMVSKYRKEELEDARAIVKDFEENPFPSHPRAATLLRLGRALEKSNPKSAINYYGEIENQYIDTREALEAKERRKSLSNSLETPPSPPARQHP